MSLHNKNIAFRHCSTPIKKKRRYTPNSAWDHIKDFVTLEVHKGTPQMTIISMLEQQSTSIEVYQFKRILKQWGLSDRNIKRRNQKYIYEIESKATKKGVTIRNWRFKDTGQSVKQSVLKRIIESDGKEFESIESSPGLLAPSPIDAIELDSLTPPFASLGLEMEITPSSLNADPPSAHDTDEFTHRITSMDNDAEEEIGVISSLSRSISSLEPISIDTYQDFRPATVVDENREYASIPSGQEEHATILAPKPDPKVEDTASLLQSLCEGIVPVIERFEVPVQDGLDTTIVDSANPYDFAAQLSDRFAPVLEIYRERQAIIARKYIQQVVLLRYGSFNCQCRLCATKS
ncbi:hypothetical protein H072_6822 [Dactylellina haptotyla CBS 200.50]|uniref:Clr5 domain-containing protein n=1 Tax=Dactylellina haptotyla (strain CBS 200.50) TaxID=1284197 RepID=S8BVS3_DACHA|nr:hypothetical protein H072_6822 [Dactylellina haptotyla CBS 200.50]